MQPIQSNVAETFTFDCVENNADCKDILHEFIDNINYETDCQLPSISNPLFSLHQQSTIKSPDNKISRSEFNEENLKQKSGLQLSQLLYPDKFFMLKKQTEVCYNDTDNGPKYTNDNLLDFINLYCNENFTPLFFSIRNMSNTENRNHNYTAQSKFSDNPQVMNVSNEHQCIFILNQSEEKTVANKKLETQILNKHSNFNEEEVAITMKHSDSSLNEQTTILAQLSPKNNERQHYELDEKRGINYRNFSIIRSVNSQKDHAIKKDENFHKKLMSLINHHEVNKLSGEIYSLEYYRSCNKLLAKKSRPLANLRQTNHDAEKKHKALVDLNKKCRSIIRKFKNGLFTIDTIFKWNESHSKDGPMSCSICRCNKFFKRPGSIANHIYRVHERILQEALERGELHEILKNSRESKKNWSTKNDQNISYNLQVDQSCYELQNTLIHETLHENSQLFSDQDLSINNWGLPLKLDIHNQYLTSNADRFELEHALKIIE